MSPAESWLIISGLFLVIVVSVWDIACYTGDTDKGDETMTENINREAITKSEATSLARKGEDAYEVRKGLRVFGFYDNIETAEAMAEFYDADVFDWATGEYA